MQKQGKDIAAERAAKVKETGRFYRYMVEHVKHVLAEPVTVHGPVRSEGVGWPWK